MGAAVGIAAAASLVFFAVLIVALSQLTGLRRSIAMRYIAVAAFSAWVLIDWLSGATNWTMIEGVVLVVAIPFGVAHLTVLLIDESRQS